MIRISADIVSLLLTLLIPVFTGLVTKQSASIRVKAVTATVAIAVVAFVTEARAPDGAAIFSTQMVFTALVALVIQISVYFGIYKPIVPAVVHLAPTKGLG